MELNQHVFPTFFKPTGSSSNVLLAISDSSIICSTVSRDNCNALRKNI